MGMLRGRCSVVFVSALSIVMLASVAACKQRAYNAQTDSERDAEQPNKDPMLDKLFIEKFMADWKVVADDNQNLDNKLDFSCPAVDPGSIDLNTREFSEKNSHAFARLSQLTYKAHALMQKEAKDSDFTVDFIRDAKTDTEVYVLSNKEALATT